MNSNPEDLVPVSPLTRLTKIVRLIYDTCCSHYQEPFLQTLNNLEHPVGLNGLCYLDDLYRLTEEARQYISQNHALPQTQLDSIDRIQRCLKNDVLGGICNQFVSHFDARALELLVAVTVNLSPIYRKNRLTKELLSSISSELETLKGAILNENFDESLKSLLVEGIEHLIDAINRFSRDGDKGIQDAIDRYIGIIRRNVPQTKQNNTIIQQVIGLVITLELLFGFTTNLAQLPDTVENLPEAIIYVKNNINPSNILMPPTANELKTLPPP